MWSFLKKLRFHNFSSSVMYILLNKYFCCKVFKKLTFILTGCREYLYISVYMIWGSFYSNETVKHSWSDSQSSSGYVVRVLMSSLRHHVNDRVKYWIERPAAQWWRLREFSLQKFSRQRGTSPGYPLSQWNGNLLPARGSVTCCLQTRLYINM